MSTLNSQYITCLVDLNVVYHSKSEYIEKFNRLRETALKELSQPINAKCLKRSEAYLNHAKQDYAELMLNENIDRVRYFSGLLIRNVIHAIVNLNNTYLKLGKKGLSKEILTMKYLPVNFEKLYIELLESKTVNEIKKVAGLFMTTIIQLHEEMNQKYNNKLPLTYNNLKGIYENCWCNYRGKIIDSSIKKDKLYALQTAISAQSFLNKIGMTADCWTDYNLMQYFDCDNHTKFCNAFLQIMDRILQKYKELGLTVEYYDSFENLYKVYMNKT